MKIIYPMKRSKPLPRILLAGLLVCGLYTPLQATPLNDSDAAYVQASRDLRGMVARIAAFHNSARSSLAESLRLPIFSEYFSLAESRHNKYDAMGRIQLSDDQQKLRQQMEAWALGLHQRFPVGETCLIDAHGQEHMRVVGGDLELPYLFSSQEHGSPFFAPSLKLGRGEVFMSEPYMSEDTHYWTVSFTAPIYQKDDSIPGFYHFEIPLMAYSDLVSYKDISYEQFQRRERNIEEEGRYFIVNRQNQVIADSQNHIVFRKPDERHPEINPDLSDYLPAEKLEDYVSPISSIFPGVDSESIAREMQHQRLGALRVKIQGRDYHLLFQPVPDRADWIIAHLDPIGGTGYWDKK